MMSLRVSLFLVGLLAAAAAGATTFVNRSLGVVVKEAPIIARGRAGDSYSDWDKGGRRNVFTYTHFVVTEVIKGEVKENKILLRQPGGAKDDIEINVPGTAHFMPGEEVVVLLGEKSAEDGAYDVPGFTTGKYNVVSERGEIFLVNSLGGAAVYDPGRASGTLSYNSKISLDTFRKIARGEEESGPGRSQYERSNRAAPRGAFEAGHGGHRNSSPSARPAASPPSRAGEKASQQAPADAKPADAKRAPWVPISFATMAVAGGVFWFFAGAGRRRRGGTP